MTQKKDRKFEVKFGFKVDLNDGWTTEPSLCEFNTWNETVPKDADPLEYIRSRIDEELNRQRPVMECNIEEQCVPVGDSDGTVETE